MTLIVELCWCEASPCGVGQQLGAFAPGENRLGRRLGSTLDQCSAVFRCQDSLDGVPFKRRCAGCRETVWIIHQGPPLLLTPDPKRVDEKAGIAL